MKSSIKNSGEIQTKEPYIKCKWCIYALCSKILIVKKYEQKRGVKNGLYKKTFRSTRPAQSIFQRGRSHKSTTGSYLSRSTGMGLYLVQKMATDLSITVELKNNSCGGTTVTLTFPKVERPFGR